MLSGEDLSGEDLRDRNLVEADMSKTVLIRANLGRKNLSGANFTQADMRECILEGCDLSGSVFAESNLTGAFINKSKGHQIKFVHARGDALEFSEAEIKGGALTGRFHGGRLSLGSFTRVDMRGVDLKRADISAGLWIECDMTGADLGGASAVNTDFFGTNLSGVNFKGADIRGADLFFCKTWGADFDEANLTGVKFDTACGEIPWGWRHGDDGLERDDQSVLSAGRDLGLDGDVTSTLLEDHPDMVPSRALRVAQSIARCTNSTGLEVISGVLSEVV